MHISGLTCRYKKRNPFHVVLLLFLLMAADTSAQDAKIHQILKNAPVNKIMKYRPDEKTEHFLIPSDFSSEHLDSIDLEGRRILKIDYVYSEYKLVKVFDQQGLNQKRMKLLLQHNQHIATNDLIAWNIYVQHGCQTPDDCKEYFHGFVVYVEKLFSKEDSKKEAGIIVARLDSMERETRRSDSIRTEINGLIRDGEGCILPTIKGSKGELSKILNSEIDCNPAYLKRLEVVLYVSGTGRVKQAQVTGPANYTCTVRAQKALRTHIQWNPYRVAGKGKPFMIKQRVEGVFTKKQLSHWDAPLSSNFYLQPDSLDPEYEPVANFKWVTKKGNYTVSEEKEGCALYVKPRKLPENQQDLIKQLFRRNPGWKPEMFVTDVTGSMYPYTTQLLEWLRLNSIGTPKQYVFFNDGDDKKTNQKHVGHTGGIYTVHTSVFDSIKGTLMEAMLAGGGGDLPENNGEALLRGLEECPECKDIILLADNYAFPRDEKLFQKIPPDRKVKIVLCGTLAGINVDYLSLALKYGYSLHTVESDITNLRQTKEGETIVIDGREYLLKDGKFERVYKM